MSSGGLINSEMAIGRNGIPREVTLHAFVAAYRTLGYEPCASWELESGFQKVAIFTDNQGRPTHAARQLESGSWTSKLGQQHDIRHDDLEGVSGIQYGTVEII